MDAKPLNGTFTVQHGGTPVVLTLEHTSGGTVRGRLTGYGGTFDLHGLGSPSGLQGSLVDMESGQRFSFSAHLQGERFHLSLFPLDAHGRLDFHAIQTLTLERREAAPTKAVLPAGAAPPAEVAPQAPTVPPTPAARPAPPARPSRPAPSAPVPRSIIVNGERLSAERLRTLPRHIRTLIPDGRYWYDATSGAWGAEGGPPTGYLPPGLDLPGPVPAHASGGGTGLFANGRELHPHEVLTLARVLGTAPPGRYWLDALGNLGLEGGPFLINLVAASPPTGEAPDVGDGARLPSASAAGSLPGPPEPRTFRPSRPAWTTPFRTE